MKKHIHLFGASGSGTTTIAKQAGERLGYTAFDSDSYFWLPTEEPFTKERKLSECLSSLRIDLESADSWILSGSVTGWGDELADLFDLIVFVTVPSDIRIARLKERESQRYGKRILPGGDRFQASQEFIEWAAAYDTGTKTGRNLQKHEAWLKTRNCPILRVENLDLENSVEKVIEAIKD